MASVSGFDALADSLGALPCVEMLSFRQDDFPAPKGRELDWILRRLGLKKAEALIKDVAPTPYWDPRSRYLTQQAIKELEASPSDALILLMACEDHYDPLLLTAAAEIRRRIVVVAHQPPAWYRLNWRDFSAFDGLAGVVCLSKSQQDFFATVTNSPIICVRHGVRADFFKPQSLLKQETDKRLLFVGQWLRDFDVLECAMNHIWEQQPETKLDCVIPRASRTHPSLYRLARDQRVVWHADIDAEALLALYQRATLLFLPLLDATANNAIIEALASGLPIVSTRVGAVDEYVSVESGELCDVGDARHHADAVLRWLNNPSLRSIAGLSGRNFALRTLAWDVISSDLLGQLSRRNVLLT